MKRYLIALAAAISLSACASPGAFLKDYTSAANDLDPGCGKAVDVTVDPMLLPWGVVVPVVKGTYSKRCHPELMGDPAAAATNAKLMEVLGKMSDRLDAIQAQLILK